MCEMIIIRGAPGSGKTTKAKKDFPYHELVEADEYFMRGDEYHYNHSEIKQAHEWCFNVVKLCIQRDQDVVVANTFTKIWEMAPYIQLMSKFTPDKLRIIHMPGSPYDSVHGVPKETINRMLAQYEPTPWDEQP